jgi:hypothetical protein
MACPASNTHLVIFRCSENFIRALRRIGIEGSTRGERSAVAACSNVRMSWVTIILNPIAVRLHYSWQVITPIPLSRNLLEPKLFLIGL